MRLVQLKRGGGCKHESAETHCGAPHGFVATMLTHSYSLRATRPSKSRSRRSSEEFGFRQSQPLGPTPAMSERLQSSQRQPANWNEKSVLDTLQFRAATRASRPWKRLATKFSATTTGKPALVPVDSARDESCIPVIRTGAGASRSSFVAAKFSHRRRHHQMMTFKPSSSGTRFDSMNYTRRMSTSALQSFIWN